MATKYSITGTAMNWSASTWGQVIAGGVVDHPVTNARLTPAVSPGWGALGAAKVEIDGTLYTVASNTADDLTITAVGPSNGTYSWVLFNEGPPGDGDTAQLNGGGVAMNIATIPAAGTLTAIAAKNTSGTDVAGQLNCVMSDAIFHGTGGVINASTITGGTSTNGVIYLSGSDNTHLLTINGNVVGGSGTNACGVKNTSTASLVIEGTVTGGTASGACGLSSTSTGINFITNTCAGGSNAAAYGISITGNGNMECVDCDGTTASALYVNVPFGTLTVTIIGNLIAGVGRGATFANPCTVNITGNVTGGTTECIYNSGTNNITVTGNITGGSSSYKYGFNNSNNFSVTINGNIIGGTHPTAVGFYNIGTGIITLNNGSLICDAAVPYIGTIPVWNNDDNASYYEQPNTGRTNKFGTIPTAGTMATGTVCGDTTGTRIDCPEEVALTTSGNYGDPDDPFVGTYVDEGGGGGDIIIGRFFNRGFS